MMGPDNSNAECVLHILHVGDQPVLELQLDGEGRSEDLVEFDGANGEAAEDSQFLALPEDVPDVELFDRPESVDIVEGLENGSPAVVVLARPGHESFLRSGLS